MPKKSKQIVNKDLDIFLQIHNTYYNNMMCYINYRQNDTDSATSKKVRNFLVKMSIFNILSQPIYHIKLLLQFQCNFLPIIVTLLLNIVNCSELHFQLCVFQRFSSLCCRFSKKVKKNLSFGEIFGFTFFKMLISYKEE